MPTMSAANRGAEQPLTQTSRHAWCHFWFTTFGAWLRGDERGFRDHDHRVHSSGDYQHPPDPREHAALRAWTAAHMHKPPVRLTPALRARAGRALVEKLRRDAADVKVLAVAAEHVHGVLLCPAAATRAVIGNAKRASSPRCETRSPGRSGLASAACARSSQTSSRGGCMTPSSPTCARVRGCGPRARESGLRRAGDVGQRHDSAFGLIVGMKGCGIAGV